MLLNEIMKKQKISKYKLAKSSKVPYTTLSDICSGKAQLEKCSAETVYKLSRELGVSMESLLEPYLEKRISFELFKSNVCHRLKELGDIDFIIDTIEKNDIRKYFQKEWYPESFYLLAMLDYISRINDVPFCTDYNDIRSSKLEQIIYPAGVTVIEEVSNNKRIREQAYQKSIPEFAKYNIVETEVRNVI